ncbi:hypothetical protein [Halosegnis longus]|nr:hypothetical protein [Halosegnis longus]
MSSAQGISKRDVLLLLTVAFLLLALGGVVDTHLSATQLLPALP